MSSTALSPRDEIRHSLERMRPEYQKVLPSHVTLDKFMRIVTTAVLEKPKLMECDRNSLYAASLKAAQDGLLPDGREGAIVPRNGKAEWQPMVAGIMKKVRNSGEVTSWRAHAVKENDHFAYQLGDEEKIEHTPLIRGDRGETIGAYSIVTLRSGEIVRDFLGVERINSIRDRSDGYNYQKSKGKTDNPWFTDYDEMAIKTVIRHHSKRLPMSTDLVDFIMQGDDTHLAGEEPETPAATPQPRQGGGQAFADRVAATQRPAPANSAPATLEGSAERVDEPPPFASAPPAVDDTII